jgi:hypothetical protein
MRALAVLPLLALAGCAYGVAEYSVRPYLDGQAAPHCCEVVVRNGKEIGDLQVSFARADNGSCALMLRESGVRAFDGQKAATDAMTATIDAAVKAAVKAALAGGL